MMLLVEKRETPSGIALAEDPTGWFSRGSQSNARGKRVSFSENQQQNLTKPK